MLFSTTISCTRSASSVALPLIRVLPCNPALLNYTWECVHVEGEGAGSGYMDQTHRAEVSSRDDGSGDRHNDGHGSEVAPHQDIQCEVLPMDAVTRSAHPSLVTDRV
jgi:hypothetical protein